MKYNFRAKVGKDVEWDLPLDIVCHTESRSHATVTKHIFADWSTLHIVNLISRKPLHFDFSQIMKIFPPSKKWASQGKVNVISRIFQSAFLFFSFLQSWTWLVVSLYPLTFLMPVGVVSPFARFCGPLLYFSHIIDIYIIQHNII